MINYKSPKSCSSALQNHSKPTSVVTALANGFAKGLQGGITDLHKPNQVKLQPVYSTR